MCDTIICAVCHGPWNNASGYLVGQPTQWPMCSRCWPEAYRCLRWATSRVAGKRAKHKLEFYPPVPVLHAERRAFDRAGDHAEP